MDGQRGLLATSFKVDKEPESCGSAGRFVFLGANLVYAGIATGSHTDDGATKFKTTTVFAWDSETFFTPQEPVTSQEANRFQRVSENCCPRT